MRSVTLTDNWQLRHVRGPAPMSVREARIPASVPGSVHTDLLSAGLIDDPFLDSNEAATAWIGQSDWRYSTEFDWVPDQPARSDAVELFFSGLDTVAEVTLNGQVLARTRNMHRSYRIDVSTAIRQGKNSLDVEFRSAVKAADAASLELGYRPHSYHHPYNALRKMACSFGWDWGPDTCTAGLWKDVTLQEWSGARLASVRPVLTLDGNEGVASVHVTVDRRSAEPLAVTATIDGRRVTAELRGDESATVLELRVPEARLWWPRGYGAPDRYELDVQLHAAGADAGSGNRVDRWTRMVGFRSVGIDMTPDGAGTPFVITVNGEAIFIKGANWIPDDPFPHRVDRDRYSRRIDQAAFAGLNLLRVWGGGIYEADDFYDLCDENGFLVWQDFLFACAGYSEAGQLWSEVDAEAREAVTRLAAHPSLILLNGNNECLWGYDEWNWKLRLDGASWGEGYYYELLPGVVADLAPHVAYTPGSPFAPTASAGSFSPDVHPNDPSHGTMHIWDLWNAKDQTHYRDYRPRFVAEFGWQAPPSWTTLTRAISDDPLTPESPNLVTHQKAENGNVKLTDGLIPHFRLPSDMRDWHWAMQLNQANAITTATEWFRSLAPHCMGSIVWQLNDCWPAVSWSAVDSDERPKPLLYALRRANADRILTVQPIDPSCAAAGLVVVAVNDTPVTWSGFLELERIDYDGTVITRSSVPVTAAPRSTATTRIPSVIAEGEDASRELIRASLDGSRAHWFGCDYRESALPKPEFDIKVRTADAGIIAEVTARSLLRDATLLVDHIDPQARVDDALVTLLPGETCTFRISTELAISADELSAPHALRTANQLVADGRQARPSR